MRKPVPNAGVTDDEGRRTEWASPSSAIRRPSGFIALAVLLLAGSLLLPLVFPQRPDADATAIAAFEATSQARFGRYLPLVTALGFLDVRHAAWPNLAGAVVALWTLDRLITAFTTRPTSHREQLPSAIAMRTDALRASLPSILALLGLLVALTGWGWERSRGWWGELYLAPGTSTALGPDSQPMLLLAGFVRPPAAHGPGRALEVTIRLDGRVARASEPAPLRHAGWVVQPRWYGGLVELAGEPALFFGESGSRSVVVAGTPTSVTLAVDTLEAAVTPQHSYRTGHYAVIRARYAPGARLRILGLVVLAGATLYRLGRQWPGWGWLRIER